MRVHGLRLCFIRPGRVQATPRSCRIRTCGMWFLGSGTASKTDATLAAVMIPISPWQPGVLAAGSGSCAADGCQHRQLTLWTNPSPGNKHRPRSITPCAPGFSRRRGNGPRRGDLPPRTHPNKALLFPPPFTASLRQNLCLRCGSGFASSAEFAQSCSSVRGCLLLAHLARQRNRAGTASLKMAGRRKSYDVSTVTV